MAVQRPTGCRTVFKPCVNSCDPALLRQCALHPNTTRARIFLDPLLWLSHVPFYPTPYPHYYLCGKLKIPEGHRIQTKGIPNYVLRTYCVLRTEHPIA